MNELESRYREIFGARIKPSIEAEIQTRIDKIVLDYNLGGAAQSWIASARQLVQQLTNAVVNQRLAAKLMTLIDEAEQERTR